MVETCTLHLDDVYRIKDDFKRGDGRIEKNIVSRSFMKYKVCILAAGSGSRLKKFLEFIKACYQLMRGQ